MTYKRPAKRLHRGFIYLDDEIVVNSLSALEAGKVDEVVSKSVIAREGGAALGAGLGAGPLGFKVDASKKANTSTEEEIVRTRTRFSLFQAWFDQLEVSKAIGRFDGWGERALTGVEPGDTVELRATMQVLPLQALFRLFDWFADKAGQTGNPFSQRGEVLKATRESQKMMQMFMGDERKTFAVLVAPDGEPGPPVVMELKDEWLIGGLDRMSGTFNIIGQVDRIVGESEFIPTMRVLSGPMTAAERDLVHKIVKGFVDPAQSLQVEVSENEGEVGGPAVSIAPIAIFR